MRSLTLMVYGRMRDLLASPNWCLEGTPGAELAEGMEPATRNIVFVKKKPSAFHGTPLLGYLTDRGVDSVIVLGGNTSKCVQEAEFDRIPISHAIALFDMGRQCADVVLVEEVLAFLAGLTAQRP